MNEAFGASRYSRSLVTKLSVQFTVQTMNGILLARSCTTVGSDMCMLQAIHSPIHLSSIDSQSNSCCINVLSGCSNLKQV